jgi:hypothetical protein
MAYFVIKTGATLALRDDNELTDFFIVECDFDAHNGMGAIVISNSPTKARRFEDFASAVEYWRTPSKVKPIRLDGMPNRPLTALTIEIISLDD